MRTFLTTAFTLCAFLGVVAADTVIYQEDFSSYQPRGNQQVVASGHPDFAHALEIKTVKDADGKIKQGSWYKGGLDTRGTEVLTIDYWIKFATDSARYAILANDDAIKSITVTQHSGGQLQVAKSMNMEWQQAGKVVIGKWHHFRYVVNCVRGDFAVYVDDMETPRVKDISYRDTRTVSLTRLWTLGSESSESTTYLGNIKVTAKAVTQFPPLSLGEWPYYVRGVAWAVKPPTSARDFVDVAPIELTTSAGSAIESTRAQVLRDADYLYVYFQMYAKDMALRTNEVVERDGRPWLNDCFEIFLQPDIAEPTYFHFVGNSSGGIYDSRHSYGNRDNSWDCDWKAVIERQASSWTALVTIPFAGVGGAPARDAIWGFNVGRENPHSKDVSSWTRLGNFHTPKEFGKLLFHAAKDERSTEVRTLDLMNRLYNLPARMAAIEQRLTLGPDASPNLVVVQERLRADLAARQAELAKAKSFTAFRILLEDVQKLAVATDQLELAVERSNAYFAKGSVGLRRGYASLVLSSMEKVADNQSNAFPLIDSAKLRLSGNEYGSFQIMLLASPGQTIGSVKTSSSALSGADQRPVSGAKVQVYLEEMVRTAKQLERGQSQVSYADVLRPGEEFTFAPSGMVLLWVDVYLPAGIAAGDYSATVTVTPAGLPPVSVPVTISATGLTLPKSASLDTAFCFGPSWVKDFYGQAPNRDQMLAYCQFILDHRLEPMNLWSSNDIGEEYFDYCAEHGKTMMFLQVSNIRKRQAKTRELLDRYGDRLRPIFFGHDEVLMSSKPGALDRMKQDYADAKELFPEVPRLNTAPIDERLFGYVDIWCPLFGHFDAEATAERQALGETVWWYPTDYPLAPYANFNLDSPGIDPRVIPWMNWKLNLTGLLYWGLNREWRSNGVFEAKQLTPEFCKMRGLDWMTPEILEKMRAGEVHWPEIPWLPYFRGYNNIRSVSRTNGGGNLLYPGENFQPLPSIRLKNLRDGMQDYEYFVMLRQQVDALKKRGGQDALVREAEAALAIDDNVVGGATSFTKDPAELLAFRDKVIDLVLRTR
jgi:hypothetical protein